MNNYTTWTSPLNMRIVGSGEYVKSQCNNLVQMFDDAEDDKLESIRQDEGSARDNYFDR